MITENSDVELAKALKNKNYIRAAMLAKEMGRPQAEIREFAEAAIKDMAVTCRNVYGIKELAEKFGYSKKDLEHLFSNILPDQNKQGDSSRKVEAAPHDRKFDPGSGKYLGFAEWFAALLKNWEKLD